MPVVLGSDILFDRQLLRGRTIGLVANPASVDARLRHVAERAEAGGVRIGALFGPQHGFTSDLQENMIESPHATDTRRRVPVYSLYSETREPTAQDARRPRCAGDRPAGRRHAHLHVHLHDGELPARRTHARCAGHRLRSAQSDRRGRGRGPRARSRVHLVRRPVSDPDAARHDDWRAGEVLQRALRPRRQARGRDHAGLVARSVFRPDRAHVDPAVAERADARQRHRLSGHGAARGHERVGRPRDDAAVRVRRRAVGRSRRVCVRPQRRWASPACTSARSRSSRRSTNTPARSAAAARSTCSIARRSSPWRSGSRSSTRFAARGPIGSPGATRRTSTNTRSRRSTSCTDRPGCERGWPAGRTTADLAAEMRQDAAAFLDERRRWLLY